MSPNTPMKTDTQRTWSRFFSLLRLERRDILQVIYFAIFSGVLSLSLPLGIQAIINLIQGAQISNSWVILVVVVTIGVGFMGALQIMQIRIIETIQQRIFTRSSFELANRFPQINAQYDRPELANRFFDTLGIQKGLSKILIDIPLVVIQIVFALILLSLYHPLFIIFGVVLVTLMLFVFRFTVRQGIETSIEESKQKYKVARWIQNVADSSVSQEKAVAENNVLLKEYLAARESHFSVIRLQLIKMTSFKVIITAGLLIIGGGLVLNQQMNIGQFVAAELIIILVIAAVEKLITSLETLYDTLTSIEKLGQVIDMANDTMALNYSAFSSATRIFNLSYYRSFLRYMLGFGLVVFIVLFLPWTQNIVGKGYVTTLSPDKRPQTIQSPIPGKIEQWWVQEGDLVEQGDTLLQISEIKSDFFDPELIARVSEQLQAKESGRLAYQQKVLALKNQISALRLEGDIKRNQALNKRDQAILSVQNDSIALIAAETQVSVAQIRLERTQNLFAKGLKATRDVEEKRMNVRETAAKRLSAANAYTNSKNQVSLLNLDIERIVADYQQKIAKAESEKQTALSSQYEAEAAVAKLKNQRANYTSRAALLYVIAPQSGYINKALKNGIGETFKEGEELLSIMPTAYTEAVETYVRPIDMPLVKVGQKVRIEFDGWPAIVFSGWPMASYGTYGARVVAIEKYISDNNMYRVLLARDQEDQPWPEVAVGSGARTIALLNNVPVWYEIWRQLNAFPPDYYTVAADDNIDSIKAK